MSSRALCRTMVLCAPLLLMASLTAAQESKEWQPDAPMPDKFDWIQLKSGEWLKGELTAMYKGQLEFDSAELDPLTFDFADVTKVLSGSLMEVGLLDGTVARGKLRIEGQKVVIIGDQTRETERSQIFTITKGDPGERSYWSGKVGVGFNFRRGNNEVAETNANVNLKRRTAKSRIQFDYLGNYNLTEDVTVTDNNRATLNWDRFVSDRFFVTPVMAEYFRDPFQNIAHRGTLGAGAGYQLVDNGKVDWQVSGGLAYQRTRFADVPEGSDEAVNTPTILVGTVYDHKLSSKVDFNLQYRILFVNEEAGKYTSHFLTGFEFDIFGNFDIDFTFVWDRIQQPQQNADGSFPKQDDYRFNFALSLDL